jgi:ketosteroid isomerase-like protein
MATKIALAELLAAIDAQDAEKFASFLTEDAVFRYGSNAPVQGRQAAQDYVAGFFGALDSLQHRLLAEWEIDDSLICEGEVTYTLPGGREVTVPFVNVFGMQGDKIKEYKIYVDPTPLAG